MAYRNPLLQDTLFPWSARTWIHVHDNVTLIVHTVDISIWWTRRANEQGRCVCVCVRVCPALWSLVAFHPRGGCPRPCPSVFGEPLVQRQTTTLGREKMFPRGGGSASRNSSRIPVSAFFSPPRLTEVSSERCVSNSLEGPSEIGVLWFRKESRDSKSENSSLANFFYKSIARIYFFFYPSKWFPEFYQTRSIKKQLFPLSEEYAFPFYNSIIIVSVTKINSWTLFFLIANSLYISFGGRIYSKGYSHFVSFLPATIVLEKETIVRRRAIIVEKRDVERLATL